MRAILILLPASLVLVACQKLDEDGVKSDKKNQEELAFAPVVDPTPSPTPSPTATPWSSWNHKPFLSAWVRTDGYYTVDLSSLRSDDQDPSDEGILINQGTVSFRFTNGTNICYAHVDISGTNDHGTFHITAINSGSTGTNAVYCNPIKTSYEYSALTDNKYQLYSPSNGTIPVSYWE